jgi:GGDEF domain-containing protein
MEKYLLIAIKPDHNENEKLIGADRAYLSADDMLTSEKEPAVIVFMTAKVQFGDTSHIASEIRKIRQNHVFCYAPVFFTKEVSGLEPVCDGIVSSRSECLARGSAILARCEDIRRDRLSDSSRLRMLAYLYARGESFEYKPWCVPGSKWIYGYPDASLIIDEDTDIAAGAGESRDKVFYSSSVFVDSDIVRSLELLEIGAAMNYIAHTKVYNRIRLCPKCETGHLNYVDVCPRCGSLSIKKTSMIHCFTCGYVAPEDKFRRENTLLCPRCGTRLRHIGSDYDHPLESYMCGDCGTTFVEPDVKASCLNCGTVSDTDSLIVKNFYGYMITERGISALRSGLLQEDIMLFDGTNAVGIQTFCGLLKWLTLLRKRYADADFSLLCVKLFGLDEAEENIGSGRLRELIGELGKRIRELVRETDITTKDRDGNFWLILPRTPIEGGNILAKRIEALSSLINENSSGVLKIEARSFHVTEEAAGEEQEKYLDSLAGQF